MTHKRFDREVWLFPHSFDGAFAKWAIRLSPYVMPDNLPEAIQKFHDAIAAVMAFGEHGMVLIPLINLKADLDTILWSIPEIAAWNESKNGQDGHKLVTRATAEIDPDNYFIDIRALAGMIVCDFAEAADAQLWLTGPGKDPATVEDTLILDEAELEQALNSKTAVH